jgi:diguanylate cyclase (GGDEF)-like protein
MTASISPSPLAQTPLAKILTASGQVGYHWDLRADHIVWFGEWQRLFGFTREQPPHNSESFAAAVAPEDRYLVLGEGSSEISRVYRLVTPEGKVLRVREQGKMESDASGPLRQCGMIELLPDANENEGSRQSWDDLDRLTKCPTRQRMERLVRESLTGDNAKRSLGAYLVVGVDRMAFVNEAVGTKGADAVLRNVAQRIVETVPMRATVARVSGDMFGILLPDEIGNDYLSISDNILANFRAQAVQTDGEPVFVTVSIGAIRFADQSPFANEIMIRAEQALNEARLRGRNVVVTYQMSSPAVETRRIAMEMGERFKYALLNNKLKLAYQPVIDAATGQVVFYEALIRMFKETGEVIPAAAFVPAVEQLGMAKELDHHVLDLVLTELRDYPELRLAMNISGLTASQADWPDYLKGKLRDTPEIAKRLIIEITETVAIADLDETKKFAEALNNLGGSVAIDDFGAGFTSIRHLSTLALSIMKIDKDMLNGIPGNLGQEHLVRMMIAIAHGLGLKTVVEGIETEEMARWLQNEKADMLQGYYFGRPSIDKPWVSLKGADMSQQKAAALFGDKLFADKAAGDVQVCAVSVSAKKV